MYTMPRVRTQTTYGAGSQRQAPADTRPAFYAPVSGWSNWLGGPSPQTPSLKSKDPAMIRDRVQFFTRNELAAAAALEKSSSSSGHAASSSKTSWFRRKLFK